MGTPRDIAEIFASIAAESGAFFGREAEDQLLGTTAVQGVAGTLPRDPERAALVCLQALAVHEQSLRTRLAEVEFVATMPTAASAAARGTAEVVLEMLTDARREVVALGYEIGDSSFLAALAEAARRVPVTLIRDRTRAQDSDPLTRWPTGVPRPVVFQDRAREGAAPYAKMHGKALLVDGEDLLISSANFTFHGLHGNLEFGVRLRGSAVGRAGEVFRAMLESELLERVP